MPRVLTAALSGLMLSLAIASASAQPAQPFADGLLAPTGLTALPDGTFLVAEAGQGPNTGRVSLVDRAGRRFTVIDALPSGLHGTSPSGPSATLLAGRRLFILIGNGDVTIPAPGGIETVNPAPSSPLFSTVLVMDLLRDDGLVGTGFSLPPNGHAALAAGQGVYVTNATGERARLERLVDLPDYIPAPRPDAPANVIISNPFGLTGNPARLDIADAARNLIWSVRVDTPTPMVLTQFPPLPNTNPALGPPVVDAVPTSIRPFRDDLLVSFLSGFPFGAGAARVVSVDRRTGAVTPRITGLQTVTDALPVTRGRGDFYVLEYSTNFLAGAPGRLLLVEAGRPPLELATGLRGPTSMVEDARTGDLIVSEIMTGRLVRVLVP